MRRIKVTRPSDGISEQQPPVKTHCGSTGQKGDNPQVSNDSWTTFMDARHQILQLLSTKLSPCALKARINHLDHLQKCSFYLQVAQDLQQQQLLQQQRQLRSMSPATYCRLIDPGKLARMKKLATSQVKIQLSLLEELCELICKGKEELEAMLESTGDQSDVFSLAPEDAPLRRKVAQLNEALLDFDSRLGPGKLHPKHRLIPGCGQSTVQLYQLLLTVKEPVVFDKIQSETLSTSAKLYWFVVGQAPQDPPEQFEIGYKLLQPANAEEGSPQGMVTCTAYSVLIGNLMPERCYEFTVKRADGLGHVYGPWIETLTLKTTPESRKRKRSLFFW